MDWEVVKDHLWFRRGGGPRFLRAHPLPRQHVREYTDWHGALVCVNMLQQHLSVRGVRYLIDAIGPREGFVVPKTWPLRRLTHLYAVFEAFKQEREDAILYAYTALAISDAIRSGYSLRKLHVPQELIDYIGSFHHAVPALRF